MRKLQTKESFFASASESYIAIGEIGSASMWIGEMPVGWGGGGERFASTSSAVNQRSNQTWFKTDKRATDV